MAKVLDAKSGKMVTEAQARVLAVLDMECLSKVGGYAVTSNGTSNPEWYIRRDAEGRSIRGWSHPHVDSIAARALVAQGVVQVWHDVHLQEFQVRRIENARTV